ncbi:MAG: hypothetical protein AAB339_10090, partial [Elusimicrobiota bacterium]
PRTPPAHLPSASLPSIPTRAPAPELAETLSDSVEDGLLWLATRQAEGTAVLDSLNDSIENGMLALALVQHRAAAVFDTVGLDLREGYRLWQKVAAAHREEKSSTPSGRNPFIASIPGAREVPALWAPLAPPPIPDRMLFRPEDRRGPRPLPNLSFGRRIDDALLPVFQGKWQTQNGLRFRINYLRPVGICLLSEIGMVYRFRGQTRLDTHARFPREYAGTYPVYWPETVVRYQVEIENAGPEPLEKLRVLAAQEDFNPGGGSGTSLGGFTDWFVPVLRTGERKLLEGVVRMSGAAEGRTSVFEQTHLNVLEEGKGAGGRELVDAPQAGLVDPPDF